MIFFNSQANITNSIIEEETEPLNGYIDRVPGRTTIDNFMYNY